MKAESTNSDFSVPDQPVGVPATFKEYIELLFDLQALAFQADITRVGTSDDGARERRPCISGDRLGRCASLHLAPRQQPGEARGYTKINTYHVEMLNYFLKKLESIHDGDATLLDRTVVLFGSGMSDGNVHNNCKVPVMRRRRERRWASAATVTRDIPMRTPLSNLMLGLTDRYGVQMEKFGDSTAAIDLTTL